MSRIINVHISDGKKWLPVGFITLDENGVRPGFKYYDSYNGPPISPDLDYKATQKRSFHVKATGNPQERATEKTDLHPVFMEALAGEWGAKVINGFNTLYKRLTPAQKLFSMGDRVVNGLAFEAHGSNPEKASVYLDSENIKKFELQAQQLQNGIINRIGSPIEQWAFTHCTGQQPKAMYTDDDGKYVAKFGSRRLYDYGDELPRVENALLEASRLGGIETVESKLLVVGNDVRAMGDGEIIPAVLCVKRFDISASENEYGEKGFSKPKHKINMATAMGFDVTANIDYSLIAKHLRSISHHADHDVKQLFGRMVFNGLTNNTDDHLAQFELLQHGDNWKLAPNFDLNIDDNKDHDGVVNRKHSLTFCGDKQFGVQNAFDFIEKAANDFEIPRSEALAIALKVAEAVEKIPQLLVNNGVTAATRKNLNSIYLDQVKSFKSELWAGLDKEAKAESESQISQSHGMEH